jgi:hypothetical protein
MYELYGLTGRVNRFPYVELVELFNLGLKPLESLTSTTGWDEELQRKRTAPTVIKAFSIMVLRVTFFVTNWCSGQGSESSDSMKPHHAQPKFNCLMIALPSFIFSSVQAQAGQASRLFSAPPCPSCRRSSMN